MARSVVAVLAGFFAVAGLSLATDQLFHVLDVYPPWGEPMYGAGLYLLALSYRIVYTLLGGFVTARLAPRAPMRHVMVLAFVGLVAGTAGVIVALTRDDLGPNWYPVAIAVTAYPCTWLGGLLATSRVRQSDSCVTESCRVHASDHRHAARAL